MTVRASCDPPTPRPPATTGLERGRPASPSFPDQSESDRSRPGRSAPIASEFTPAERVRYHRKLGRCFEAFERMLAEGYFRCPDTRIGLELELNLTDRTLAPAMANTAVLAELGDPAFTTELSRHNLELNLASRPLAGDSLGQWERELGAYLDAASRAADDKGGAIAMIGILPTGTAEQFAPDWMTSSQRYTQLNSEILATRGEGPVLDIAGVALPGRSPERVSRRTETILPEASCTATQLHIQVPQQAYADYYNAAQCLAGPQLAAGANAPFLLGHALWQETRIPLFEQSVDTRPQRLAGSGGWPRVWFGRRWISSVAELFEENLRCFPGLLPEVDQQEPAHALAAGAAPELSELRLHSGTVWRWNRPVYDVADGVAHLRIENRVLPAGPTVIDMLANAAFFYGAQRALAANPVCTRLPFAAAEANFYRGARHGMGARLCWPASPRSSAGGLREWPAGELMLRVLLPLAREGLREAGVPERVARSYLHVLERRCALRRTGASWQRAAVARREARGMNRDAAVRGMLADYLALTATGAPVHTWPFERP